MQRRYKDLNRFFKAGLFVAMALLLACVPACGGTSDSTETLPELENAQAYYDLGGEYEREQRLDDAIAAYSKAIELDPNLAAAYRKRGFSYYKLRKGEEAIKDYEKFIELEPDSSFRNQIEEAIYKIGRNEY